MGGPMPYVAGMHGKGCLLIDFGESAAEHRWKTAAGVLDAAVRFWREFFGWYHPDLETREGVRN